MVNLQELKKFLEFYFSHPYWESIGEKNPWIRLEFLPSAWLKGRAKAVANEKSFRKEELTDKKLEKILENSEKGFDIYFFCNVVPHETAKFAESKDVVQRLYIPIDIDYHLPFHPEDFSEETGLVPVCTVETSKREGISNHQFLFEVAVEEGGAEYETLLIEIAQKTCRTFYSDSVIEPKRILRLPGTINWKLHENGIEKSAVKLIKTATAREFLSYTIKDFEEILSRGAPKVLTESYESSLKYQRSVARKQGQEIPTFLDGSKNEYGHWDLAYKKAERREATVIEGGRHNALISWGGQMARERIAADRIKQNLIFLGKYACAPSYFGDGKDGGKDFIRMWEYLEEHIAKVNKEESFEDEQEFTQEEFGELIEGWGEEILRRQRSAAGEARRSDGLRDRASDSNQAKGSSSASSIPDAGRDEACIKEGEKSEIEGRHTATKSGCDEDVGTNSGRQRAEGSVDGQQRKREAIPADDKGRQAPSGGKGPKELRGKEPSDEGVQDGRKPDRSNAGGDVSGSQEALSTNASEARAINDDLESRDRSPLQELEAELKQAELLALSKFKNIFASYLTENDAGLKRAARLIRSLNFYKKADGDESRVVDVFHGLFNVLHCSYGENYSAIAKLQTSWGSIANYTVALSEPGLVSVIDHAFIDSSRWVRENQEKLAKVPELERDIALNKKYSLTFGATGKIVNTVVKGLKRRVGGEFTATKSQPRRFICFQNGVFDCLTARFIPDNTACLKMAHPLMVKYVEEEPKEVGQWMRFLNFAFPNDPGTIEAIYRMMGYIATPDNTLQHFFMLEGVTGSGKSTLSGVLMECLGTNNATVSMYKQLAEKDSLSHCEGKIFCSIDEAEHSDGKVQIEIARRLKEVTGGEKITLRPLHQAEREVVLPTRLMLLSNKGIQFEDTNGALERRLVTFKFDRRVPEDQVVNNADFRRQLLSEADAIMSEAARRYGAVYSKREMMFKNVDSLALKKGKEGARASLDPIPFVLEKFISKGDSFIAGGVLIKIVLELKPELWDHTGGRNWVAQEIKKYLRDKFGSDQINTKVPISREAFRGYKGVQLNIESVLDEVPLDRLCAKLDKGSLAALEYYSKVNTHGFGSDYEDAQAVEDLNH